MDILLLHHFQSMFAFQLKIFVYINISTTYILIPESWYHFKSRRYSIWIKVSLLSTLGIYSNFKGHIIDLKEEAYTFIQLQEQRDGRVKMVKHQKIII